MADLDDLRDGTSFGIDVRAAGPTNGAGLKGLSGYDWGIRSRMGRVFSPRTGRTVMLAFDHGYFQGPTSGLERLDLSIVPLIPQADAIMLTRGALRSTIPPQCSAGVVLRASGGPSILRELSDERVALDMDDALRLDAAAVAVQVFIGSDNETQSVANLTALVDAGQAGGVPVLAVTAVGKELTRDARYFRLATRIPAELGAHFVKTYYVDEGFDTVTAACPVPIIVAGGKKVPEADALHMAFRAIQGGAAGVDMGRNIFQSDAPSAMLTAVRAVVHDDLSDTDALEMFEDLSSDVRGRATVDA